MLSAFDYEKAYNEGIEFHAKFKSGLCQRRGGPAGPVLGLGLVLNLALKDLRGRRHHRRTTSTPLRSTTREGAPIVRVGKWLWR